MRSKIVWVLAGTVVLTVPVLAQSAATDTLSALLVEVRQLRIAMERAATTAPQIQLLGTRLSIQSERLARAGQDHDSVKRELDEVSASAAQLAARISEVESRAAQETNPERQRAFAEQLVGAKDQVAELTAREQRLRVRESELAATLGAEQNHWADLNRRFDEVERSLGARQPR